MPGLSGVGISFGADRIYDVLNQLELYPEDAVGGCRILFINFGLREAKQCMAYARKLRTEGISAEVYPDSVKMKKQMSYANAHDVPYVALVGENEIKEGKLMLKDMVSGNQQLVSIEEVVELLNKS